MPQRPPYIPSGTKEGILRMGRAFDKNLKDAGLKYEPNSYLNTSFDWIKKLLNIRRME